LLDWRWEGTHQYFGVHQDETADEHVQQNVPAEGTAHDHLSILRLILRLVQLN
jgi:hypothetical protein